MELRWSIAGRLDVRLGLLDSDDFVEDFFLSGLDANVDAVVMCRWFRVSGNA